MENNTETKIIKTDESFKQALVKIAVATAAATIAKKFAEVIVEKMYDRHQSVAVETIA